MEWQEIAGNWVLIPRQQVAIVHFLGGAFVATAPQVTYRRFLEDLAEQGYIVVATPFVNTLDHKLIAQDVLLSFERAITQLQNRHLLDRRYLPIYGIGHSMGCKLHLLIGSLFAVERAGNIFISYNNYAAREAIPLVEQFSSTFSQFSPSLSSNLTVEFTPSPRETNVLISQGYRVKRNLLIKFTDDTIDQTMALGDILVDLFPNMVTIQRLRGNHLTPLGQDFKWQPGANFTPFDAIGQWVRQEVYRDLNRLKEIVLKWLNPSLT